MTLSSGPVTMEDSGVSQVVVDETAIGCSKLPLESPPYSTHVVRCSKELSVAAPDKGTVCPSDLREPDVDLVVDTKKGDDNKAFTKEVMLLMQSLNTLATPEEKLAALRKLYADQLEENRCVQKQLKALEKKHSLVVKEKAHLQREHGNAILGRSKMEDLCRELNRRNKGMAREFAEQRKEDMKRVQVTKSEIEAQMEQYNAHNNKLRQENLELSEKLKKLIEQYELREEHMDQVVKHKDLQQQLMTNKMERMAEMMAAIEEKHQREKDLLLQGATESNEQETRLKQQLSQCMAKFEGLRDTLVKSNDFFATYRQELEKMEKQTKKLEKESTQWRSKCQSSNQAVLRMAEEKMVHDVQCKAQQEKQERLEKLCRALQQERNDLNKQLTLLREQGRKEEGAENVLKEGSQGGEGGTTSVQVQGGEGGNAGVQGEEEDGGVQVQGREETRPLGPTQLTAPVDGSGSVPDERVAETEADGVHQPSTPPALEEELEEATTDGTTTTSSSSSLSTASTIAAVDETTAASSPVVEEEVRDQV